MRRSASSAWRAIEAGLLTACLGMVALLTSTNAEAQQGYEQNLSEKPQIPLGAHEIPKDPYSRAMSFKQKGQYSEAMPLLQAMAEQGHGFEIAQFELGKCYFDLGARAATPEEAQKNRTLGFAWILVAAESGLGTAQEELVRLYIDGNGVPVDNVEAGKWYLLWRRNPSRMQLGSSQFDAVLEGKLKNNLAAAGWQDAEQRAKTWRPS